MSIVLRKSGNLLDVSVDGDQPLPNEIRQLLEPPLTYERLKFNYGADRYDPISGIAHSKVETSEKHCFKYDAFGRLITNFGFVYKLHSILRQAGIPVELRESYFDRPRPDCYEVDLDSVFHHFKFRPRQAECLEAIIKSPCGIVHAVTGFGKLVMITMAILAYPNAKIAVVTRRAPLINKIASFLTRYVPDVGQVGAANGKNRKGKRVTVYTCASLHHADFDADFLFVDEGHEAIADKSARELARFMHSRNFTFTATPRGRIDGTDIRLEALFGRTVFYISYPEAVALDLVVPIRVEWSDVMLHTNPCEGLDDVEKKRVGIWTNQERNKIIADRSRTFGDDEQVLILTETIEHAVHLRQFLPEYTLVYDQMEAKRFSWYKTHNFLPETEPEMTPTRKESLRVAFEQGHLKKAIATKMWAVGIDPTQLTMLFRAEGSDSEILDQQAPGRVSRTHSGGTKEVGIVCDCLDQFDSSFARRAKSRRSHYSAMGWDQFVIRDGELLKL